MVQVQLSFFSIFLVRKFGLGTADSFRLRLYLWKAGSSCFNGSTERTWGCVWVQRESSTEMVNGRVFLLWIPYPQLIAFLCTDTQKAAFLCTTLLFKEAYTSTKEAASLFTQIYSPFASLLTHFQWSFFSICIHVHISTHTHTYTYIPKFLKHKV